MFSVYRYVFMVVCLCVLGFTEGAEEKCPSGFVGNSWGCYKISTTIRYYEDSKSFCEENGAHMVLIESKEELDGLIKLMGDNGATRKGYWTGGRAIENEETGVREFFWDEDGDVPFAFENWTRGEPNGDGPCVMFGYYPGIRQHSKFADVYCSGTRIAVVCEI